MYDEQIILHVYVIKTHAPCICFGLYIWFCTFFSLDKLHSTPSIFFALKRIVGMVKIIFTSSFDYEKFAYILGFHTHLPFLSFT